jgi:hypothetical protein
MYIWVSWFAHVFSRTKLLDWSAPRDISLQNWFYLDVTQRLKHQKVKVMVSFLLSPFSSLKTLLVKSQFNYTYTSRGCYYLTRHAYYKWCCGCFCEFFVLTHVAHCKSQALFNMGSCCCAYCCLAGLLDTTW